MILNQNHTKKSVVKNGLAFALCHIFGFYKHTVTFGHMVALFTIITKKTTNNTKWCLYGRRINTTRWIDHIFNFNKSKIVIRLLE